MNVLTMGSLAALALTARLEAFFMLSVAAGMQRACYFVVPFAVVNDIIQVSLLQSGICLAAASFTIVWHLSCNFLYHCQGRHAMSNRQVGSACQGCHAMSNRQVGRALPDVQ